MEADMSGIGGEKIQSKHITEEKAPPITDLEGAFGVYSRIKSRLQAAVKGRDDVIELIIIAVLSDGHVLLEDFPGSGKTTLAKALGDSIIDDMPHDDIVAIRRIQFTPDLLPSDVTGTTVFDPNTNRFFFRPGPLFAHIVLADEINRATPKTQSALLEAMQEHACTIAGKRHAMVEPFFVMATENPIEMEGTYPLPEAQLDRFLLKVLVPNPSEDELTNILVRTTGHAGAAPERVLTQQQLLDLRSLCRDVAVAEPVLRYAARLVGASDPDSADAPDIVRQALRFGAGVRGAQSLILAAKARALLAGRPHISLDDVATVTGPVLRHRMIRSFEGEADGITTDDVIEALVKAVPARPSVVERASA